MKRIYMMIVNIDNTIFDNETQHADVMIVDDNGRVVSHEEHGGKTVDEAVHLAAEFALNNLKW
jgi:hypothetical protein